MAQRGVMITQLPKISLRDITDEDQIAIVDVSENSVTKSANIGDLKKVFGEGGVDFRLDETLEFDESTNPKTLGVNTNVIPNKKYVNNLTKIDNDTIVRDENNKIRTNPRYLKIIDNEISGVEYKLVIDSGIPKFVITSIPEEGIDIIAANTTNSNIVNVGGNNE